MLESHIRSGNQNFTPGTHDLNQLQYGTSITDKCIDGNTEAEIATMLSQAVRNRNGKNI